MNGEERSYGWVRPTSRHLSREFERRYGVRNARSFVNKYSCRARFECPENGAFCCSFWKVKDDVACVTVVPSQKQNGNRY
ncbi:unnamed protein product [Wuchereria bancrofti]|uniref:Uncharacterized protein n=1 Tax=Wuchereria bancrofti TaxID=6293 RepID=A0A3P7GMT1_WUCBA|nr:unnamed protein product [Wuchereria bancrofti]